MRAAWAVWPTWRSRSCTTDSGSWRQEVEQLNRHSHPNIVTLLGCAVDEGGSVAVIFEWLSVGDVMYRLHRSLFDGIEFY